MIDLEDTVPRLPSELHRSASLLARSARALFLTEGYLFLALLRSERTGPALARERVVDEAVSDVLGRLAPRIEAGSEPSPVMRISPGYRQIEARAQGIALVSNRALDEIDVLLALLWDPSNEVGRVLFELGYSRQAISRVFLELRPPFSELQWPPSRAIELVNVGAVTKDAFIEIAPALRSLLDPEGVVWQPIHQGENAMEIWVDKNRLSAEVSAIVSSRAPG